MTERGHALSDRIMDLQQNAQQLHCPDPFAFQVQTAFTAGRPLICIFAAAIAVRTLAPVLTDKYQDPPVLVLDEAGDYVVPLLGGHQAGANRWAAHLADQLNAEVVITTAHSYA